LQQHADDFKALNAELIFVFREETEGVDGPKKIKENTQTDYTLATDLDRESSAAYSSKKGTFDNYVLDRKGTIKAILPGTLRTRATAEQLLKHFKELEQPKVPESEK